MAKNYPETNPYTGQHAALVSAYERGWNHGHGIACHNVPTLGDNIWVESMGRVTVDAENIREVHQSCCFEAESFGRCFSPFEFIANEFNEHGEGDDDTPSAEELWDAFDEGISAAIEADLAEYTDENYGIESESDAA
jgi:hypothetical protein